MAGSTISSPHLMLFSLIILWFLAQSAVCDEKVALNVYYEARCPACSDYIVHNLSRIFNNGLIDIVDLNLMPYGNAMILENGTITCQGGWKECDMNTMQACAIELEPQDLHFKFIYCIEKRFIGKAKTSPWKSCLHKLPYSGRATNYCFENGLGKKLELHYAKATDALSPPHQYVPWVTVNDFPLHYDFQNFMRYICIAYKGVSLPKACRELPPMDVLTEEAKAKVCLLNDTSPTTYTRTPPHDQAPPPHPKHPGHPPTQQKQHHHNHPGGMPLWVWAVVIAVEALIFLSCNMVPLVKVPVPPKPKEPRFEV